VEHQTTGRQDPHAKNATGSDVAGTLDDLDWHDMACQSEAGCNNPAMFIVHVHAIYTSVFNPYI